MAYQTAQRNPRSLTLPKNYRCSGYVMEDVTWLVGLLHSEVYRDLKPISRCCQFDIEVVFQALDVASMNRWIKIKWRTRNLLCSCSCFFNNSPRQWPPEATRFLFLDFFLLCGRCQTLTWRIEESVAWSLKKRERSWLEKVWEKKEVNTHKLNASFWLTFCPSTPSIVSCVMFVNFHCHDWSPGPFWTHEAHAFKAYHYK